MYLKTNHDENINSTMSTIKVIILNGMILLIVMLIICLFIKDRPIVKYSVSTEKCVEIEIEGKCYDCSRLKYLDKYETEFVK